MNLKSFLPFLLLAALFAGSCTEKEKTETEKNPVANKSTATNPAFDADGEKSGGAFSITEDSIRLYVSASNGVSIRTQANATAPEITRVRYGDKLTYSKDPNYENNGEKVLIEGIPAYWMPVTYKGQTGYVPDITVFPFPPPAVPDSSLEDWIRHIAKPLGPRFEQKPNWDKMGDMGTGIVRQLYDNGAVYSEGSGYEWGHTMLQLPATNVRTVLYAMRNLSYFSEILQKGGTLRSGKYQVPGQFSPYKWTVDMEGENGDWLRSVEINWEDGGYSTLKIMQVEADVIIISSSGV